MISLLVLLLIPGILSSSLCPNGQYSFGDKCVSTCPANSQPGQNSVNNTCLCMYFYSGSGNDLTCHGKDEFCPNDNYVKIGERKCNTGPPSCNLIRKVAKGSKYYYQCTNECKSNEYMQINKPGDSPAKPQCKDSCDTGYYHREGENECILGSTCKDEEKFMNDIDQICYSSGEECLTKYKYYDTVNYKCVDDCGTNFLDVNENKCVSDCDNKYYKYQDSNTKLCLKNCGDMKLKPYNDVSGGVSSFVCKDSCPANNYFTIDRDVKICHGNGGCKTFTIPPYDITYSKKIDGTHECVNKCGPSYMSENGNICYKYCYSNLLWNSETKKCVGACPYDLRFIYDKTCYRKCPGFAPYYSSRTIDDSDNTLQCYRERCPGGTFKYFSIDDPYKCTTTCSNFIMFQEGTHVSIDIEIDTIKYTICVTSVNCPLSYPYKYLKELKCFKERCPSEGLNLTSYDFENRQTLCFSSHEECHEKKWYVQGKECVVECDPVGYPFKLKIYGDSEEGGYCFKDVSECYRIKDASGKYFVYSKNNLCLTQCPTNEYSIQNETDTNHPYKRYGDTCVTTCPTDFPYSDNTNKICYKSECPPGTYVSGFTSTEPFICEPCGGFTYDKICVENCEITDKPYHYPTASPSGHQACLVECPTSGDSPPYKYHRNYTCLQKCASDEYYHPNTNECLKIDSCITVKDFPYTPKETNLPLACKASCGNEFYYEEDKKCLSSCDQYNSSISSNNNKICVKTCKKGEMLDQEKKNCVTQCPSSQPYFYYSLIGGKVMKVCRETCVFSDLDETGTPKDFKMRLSSNNQCVPECTTEENYLHDPNQNICYKNCTTARPYYKINVNPSHHICYDFCFNSGTNPYHIFGKKECLLNCPNNKKFLINDNSLEGSSDGNTKDKVYLCREVCPSDYPIAYGGEVHHTYCVKTCPNNKVELDYHCVDYCNLNNDGYKPYLYEQAPTSTESKFECREKCGENRKFSQKTESITNHFYYECKIACDTEYEYITPDNDCVKNYTDCPKTANFITIKDGKRYCNANCTNRNTYFLITEPDAIDKYYICLNDCVEEREEEIAENAKYYKHENISNNECYKECSGDYYKIDDRIPKLCRINCLDDSELTYSDPDSRTCKDKCPGSLKYYNEPERICKASCDTALLPLKNEDPNKYECLAHCDKNSLYKFQTNGSCKLQCDGTERYYEGTYNCTTECKAPYNFVTTDNSGKKLCAEKCKNGEYANKNGNEYICESECNGNDENKVYFETDNICMPDCGGDGYKIFNSKKCVKNCTTEGGIYKYFYTPDNGDQKLCVESCLTAGVSDGNIFTLNSGHCAKNCSNNETYRYYLESQKRCLSSCPEGTTPNYKNVDSYGIKCVSNCMTDGTDGKVFRDEFGNCVIGCNISINGYIHYEPGNKICRKNCSSTKYYFENNTDDHQCVDLCSQDTDYKKTFTYGKDCVQQCPFEMKYFVNETNIKKCICLNDCPSDNKYLFVQNKTIGDVEMTLYQCNNDCPNSDKFKYYSTDPNITHITCLKICPSPYKFYVDNEFKCLSKCPEGKPFYIPPTNPDDNIECIQKCPTGTNDPAYHKDGSNICIKECDADEIIDYKTKTCLKFCHKNTGYIGEKLYCFDDDCGRDNFPPESSDNAPKRLFKENRKCIKNCNEYPNAEENGAYACRCPLLYYIDEKMNETKCIADNIITCALYDPYPYKKSGGDGKQCIKTCTTAVTPDNTCLPDENCPEGTELTQLATGKFCLCEFGSYTDNRTGIAYCLEEKEECPTNSSYFYPYKILDKKECVLECPKGNYYTRYYHLFCYDSCPAGLQQNETSICYNDNHIKWYKKDKFEIVFVGKDTCPGDYPFNIEGTDECVQDCFKNDSFPILFGNLCKRNCLGLEPLVDITNFQGNYSIPSDRPYKTYADLTCKCNNQWYFDDLGVGNGILCSEVSTNCPTFTKEHPYEMLDDHECVDHCLDRLPYSYNYKCYLNCQQPELEGKFNGVFPGTKECKCKNPWRKVFNPETGFYDRKCEDNEYCGGKDELVLKATGECYPGRYCPESDPWRWNYECINDTNSCPEGTERNETSGEKICKCKGKWEKKEHPVSGSLVPLVKCLDDCSYSNNNNNLLVEKTNECVHDCASITSGKYYEFNGVCYIDSCPKATKEDESNPQKCVCDPTYGYWYNTNNKLYCGKALEECPNDKTYYIKKTKECVADCENLYRLGKACYEQDDCPRGYNPVTDSNDNKNYCKSDSFNDANNLKELKELVDKDYINLILDAENGKVIDKFDEGTLHAYKLKKNTPGLEYNVIKKNLTLINLDKCIKNVYDANGLSDNAYIYVVKYDIKNNTKDYLYNTAEYDFYSREDTTTGDPVIKKLDISICTGYSVSVSYPIINYIEDKNCPFNESVKNEFMSRFVIAKKVHDENPNVDLFNYNDSIYYNICTPFSIDNKDVILRDRRNFLYPGIHLCENNCTPAYTDYVRERFVCDCLIKSNIFLDRNGYPSETNNFGNFSFNNTKVAQRGPTNFPVLLCINNFKHDKKNVVKKNAGFYYAVIVGGAIVLCGIVSFFSYFVLSKKIKKKIGLDAVQKAEKEKTLTASQKRLNTSTERNDAAPPPRKGEIDFEDKNRRIKNIDYGEKIDVMDYSGDIEPEEEPTCLTTLRKEEKLMKASFENSVQNDDCSVPVTIFSEILNKIYLTRTIFFLKKYDMIVPRIALYLLYHLLTFTLLITYFNIKTLSKIFRKTNYPDAGFYILYGFISLLIMFIVYTLFSCLLNNDEKIAKLIHRRNYYKKKGVTDFNILTGPYEEMMCKIKAKLVLFYIITIVFVSFCFIYISIFCGVYTKTKKRVFIAYIVTLVVFLVIKVIYGIVLGALRRVAIDGKKKCLYKTVRFFDIYLS